MDVMRTAGFAVFSALAALVLRRMRPEMGVALALASGAMLLLTAFPLVGEIASGVQAIAREGGVESGYLTQLLKVAGVSLLTDFAAQTCRDAGEEGISQKVSLCGRVMLLALAMPAMQKLLRTIIALSP